MKKLLTLAILIVSLAFSACNRDQLGTFQQLPQQAQTIINQHFDQPSVSYVRIDKDLFSTEYEVVFNDGVELDFNKKGELLKADCKRAQLPDALLPQPVLTYVQQSFPDAFVTEWKRDDRRWKAELNNGLELIFNKNYDFVGIDD